MRQRFLEKFPHFQFLLASMLCLLVAAAAMAQTTTATIKGTVTDESGNAFPGATITATSTTSGYTHDTTAANDGTFSLGGLTPGAYKISVAGPAYKASTQDVTLLVGQTVSMNFRLRPEMVQMEEVTVIGNVPVEMETSQVATNVTRQQIEALPQNDRNFLNFAALAPGVQLGTDELRKEVKAGAQGSQATNIYIDGVSFKNDVIQGGVVGQDSSRGNPFPQNAVQEFRVITQNYSAEFEKASSAIITAVTRSGSNTLSGDGFVLYQDKSLVAENPLNGLNPTYERYQYGLNLGGPIIRDRMHYFASFESNHQDREETVTLGGGFQNHPELRSQLASFAGTFVQPFRSNLAFGKIDFQPGASSLLEWSANYRHETDIRDFSGQTSRQSATNVKNDVWGTNLHHQFTASNWLNEAAVSYQDFLWHPSPINPDQVGLNYEGLLRIGGFNGEQKVGQKRLGFRDDVTFANRKFFMGSHNLKVGATAEFLDYTITKHFNENPVFFFASDISATVPYKAEWGYGNPDLSENNNEYGIYGQDDWSVNDKLTLNLGLRWDYETNMFDTNYKTPANVRAALESQFPAKYFADGNDRNPKTDLFQPRLGFSYDIFGTAKTVVFGGAGRYYDRNLFNNIIDERFRLQHTVGQFFFSETGDPVRGNNAVKWDPKYLTVAGLQELQATGLTGRPQVFLIANDTGVPYSNQWNLGVRQSFGSMVASATYSNIRSYNGFTYIWGAGSCCKEYPPFAQVLLSSDDVRTWYDAVYLTLDRPYTSRGNSGFGYNIAYTWSDAEQIGGDLFSLDLPTLADWPRYGTPGTSDHRIVANGIVGIPWEARLSTLVQYSSGDKFRIHDFSKGFCVGCYVPRTGEGPSWTTVDLRLDKDFHFAGAPHAGVSLEAFNIFNEKRYVGYQDFNPPEGNPNLGKPTAIVGGSQRRFQVGLRFGF